MKKFMICLLVVLFSLVSLSASANDGIKKAIEKNRKVYKEIVDTLNQGWGQEAMRQANAAILAYSTHGQPVPAAVIAQIVEFNSFDTSRCADGEKQKNFALNFASKYTNTKNGLLMQMSREDRESLKELLNEMRNYQQTTKTRAINFSNSCRRKVLNSR